MVALQYLERYRSKPTSTIYRLDERQRFPPPKISVCRTPSFKRREMELKSFYNTSFPTFVKHHAFLLDNTIVGEWRPTLFINEGEDNSKNFELNLCYTLHHNKSLGFGGERSGYYLEFDMTPYSNDKNTTYWEVNIHRDLTWASMYMTSTYTTVRVNSGTYNHVTLSAKDVHQLNTQNYPCESMDGYSRDEGEDNSKNFELNLCYTLHHNISLGFGGERSGYYLEFVLTPCSNDTHTTYWEVNIHRDLRWASMYMTSTYTTVRVNSGTYNHVTLSAKDVHQLNTQNYPCESMDGYSRDECMDTCLLEGIYPQLSCRLASMNVSLPLCDNMGEIVNMTRTYQRLLTNTRQSDLNCSCPPPCNRLRYTMEVGTQKNSFDDNGNIWIYFPEDIVEVLVEKEAYDLIQAVGEFGGCLGMFLGISLVSLYESLDQLIRIFIARRVGIK
ncbi:unnamed protein product [Darwinula stevensoni]|uniref:Uncharacterized protein n=1 Tax=Darwinula stevensoni TaxID=69355 RepID=A0A7R9FMX9_9CRUS|nr:unnamed protein product [Darwinula stevensoni]CAG0896207.1 unnamed protein product [Darwinula stevensoni]